MLLRTVFSLRAALLLILPMIAFCSAAQTNECDTKANEIQQQIDYAKQHGNTRRAAGLETALKEVKSNCTVESLKAERQKKLMKSSAKLLSVNKNSKKPSKKVMPAKLLTNRKS